MDDNRYFRFIWRINGIAIMCLVLFVIGFGAYNLIREMFSRDRHAVITNVADDPRGEEKWTLGSPQEIDGTRFVYVPLVSEKKNLQVSAPALSKSGLHEYAGSYFSPSRNLLFVDKSTRDMKWLFKDNGQLIADIDLLSAREEYEKNRKVDAILYRVIDRDTNGDRQLTSEDLADIALSNPDGTNYKEVLPSVEHLIGTMNLDGKEVLVLHQSKGKGYASTVRLRDMSVVDTKEMPKTEKIP